MVLFLWHQFAVTVVVDVGWMCVKCKLWVQQYFIVPFYSIVLVVINSSKNKIGKVDGFGVIFDGI